MEQLGGNGILTGHDVVNGMQLVDLRNQEEEAAFQRRLSSFSRSSSGIDATIGVVTRHTAKRYVTLGAGDCTPFGEAEFPSVGCIAQVFTAALTVQAAMDRVLDLDAEVKSYTRLHRALRIAVPALVTMRHLLNHTHGMPDISPNCVNYNSDGSLDCSALAEGIAGQDTVSTPGAIYSYSCTGSIVAAATLEALYREPYSRLLSKVLPVECYADSIRPQTCSATGKNLRLSLDTLLSWCALCLNYRADELGSIQAAATKVMTQQIITLPGWATEVGVGLGWKYYGDGWFGHNGMEGNRSLALRINPVQGVAVAIAGKLSCVTSAYARLGSEGLWRIPRIGDSLKGRFDCPQPDIRAHWESEYINGRVCLKVVACSAQELTLLRLEDGGNGQAFQFRAYAPDVFVAKSPIRRDCALIQRVQRNCGLHWLWNGAKVYAPQVGRRTDS